MMAFKWLIYALTIKPEIFSEMIDWIFARSATDQGSRLDGIILNVREALGNVWWNISEVIFIGVYAVKIIKNRIKFRITVVEVLFVFLMGLMPIVRYFIFANHVTIHYWVTYRILMLPILAINIMIVKAGRTNDMGRI